MTGMFEGDEPMTTEEADRAEALLGIRRCVRCGAVLDPNVDGVEFEGTDRTWRHYPHCPVDPTASPARVSATGPPKWRVGRTVKRTIYIQQGDEAAKGDRLIGLMDTPVLAALVVNAVNEYIARQGREMSRAHDTSTFPFKMPDPESLE